MIPELMQSFDVSVATLGSLSAFYFYAYAIAQVPVGILIDRFGTREILTLACSIITIGSLLFGLTDNFIVADICRLLIGFGSAFAFVGCLKLGTIWFPSHRFAFIVGLTNLLGITGAIVGGKPVALAVDSFGWRNVMFGSAIIGLIITILLWQILIDHPAHQPSAIKKSKRRVLVNTLLATIKHKQIWAVAVFGGLMVAPIATYSELWGVTYIMQNYNLPRPEAAQIASCTFVGIAVGGPLIGWLSDHLGRRKFPMFIGWLAAFMSISCILFCSALPLWLLAALHFTFGLFTSAMLLCFSLAAEVTVPKIRATTIALVNMVIMIFGATLQAITSVLLGYSQANFMIAFTPLILCYLLAIYCFKYIYEPRGDYAC